MISFSANTINFNQVLQWKPLFKPYLIHYFELGGSGADVGPLKTKTNVVMRPAFWEIPNRSLIKNEQPTRIRTTNVMLNKLIIAKNKITRWFSTEYDEFLFNKDVELNFEGS